MPLFLILLFASLSAAQARPAEAIPLVAVLDIKQIGLSAQESEILSDRLRSELSATGRVRVMERSDMDRILNGQYAGCMDASCGLKAGALLRADEMVVGSVSKIGEQFTFTLRVVDVSSPSSGASLTIIQDMQAHIEVVASKGIPFLAGKIAGTLPSDATLNLPRPALTPVAPAPEDNAYPQQPARGDPRTGFVDIDGYAYAGNTAALQQPENREKLEDLVSSFHSAKHRAIFGNIFGQVFCGVGSVLVQQNKDQLQGPGVGLLVAGGALEIIGTIGIIQAIIHGAQLASFENELGVQNVDVSFAPIIAPQNGSVGMVANLGF